MDFVKDWPPRLCDIAALCDIAYVKSKVYANNHASIRAWDQNDKSVIRQLLLEMHERYIENWT